MQIDVGAVGGLTGGARAYFDKNPPPVLGTDISTSKLSNDLSTCLKKIAQREGVDIRSVLGHGGYGTIYHVRTGDTDLALKVAQSKYTASLKTSLKNEAELMGELSSGHSGILSINSHGVVDDREYILMPKVEPIVAQNSRDIVSLEEALDVTFQVAKAIEYCHRHNVEHRDVSRGNIGRIESRVVIFDFGFAKRGTNDFDFDPYELECGVSGITLPFKQGYTPPQILEGDIKFGDYDTYALGVLLYKLATGFCPISADPQLLLIDENKSELFSLFSKEHRKFTSEMCAYFFNALNVSMPHSVFGKISSKNLLALQGVDYIVQKAIHKDPNKRYRSSVELVEDLLVFQ